MGLSEADTRAKLLDPAIHWAEASVWFVAVVEPSSTTAAAGARWPRRSFGRGKVCGCSLCTRKAP